jgi:hypothetical protein
MATNWVQPPRRIDDHCTFAYIVLKEAWYRSAVADELPSVQISADADGGGVKWEFDVQEHVLGGTPYLRLRIFGDAFQALADVPEFFEALHREVPTDLGQLRRLLDRLGAKDITKRAEGCAALPGWVGAMGLTPDPFGHWCCQAGALAYPQPCPFHGTHTDSTQGGA